MSIPSGHTRSGSDSTSASATVLASSHSHNPSANLGLFTHAVHLFHIHAFSQSLKAHRSLLRHLPRPQALLPPAFPPQSTLGPSSLSSPSPQVIERAHIYLNIAIIRLHLGEFALAAESIDKSLSLSPRLAIAWYLLGLSLFQLGAYRRAERRYKRCLACLEPSEDTESITVEGTAFSDRAEGEQGAPRQVGSNTERRDTIDYRPLGLNFVLKRVRIDFNIRLCYLWKLHKQIRAERPRNWCLNRLPAGLIFEPVTPPWRSPGHSRSASHDVPRTTRTAHAESVAAAAARARAYSLPSHLVTPPRLPGIFSFKRIVSPKTGHKRSKSHGSELSHTSAPRYHHSPPQGPIHPSPVLSRPRLFSPLCEEMAIEDDADDELLLSLPSPEMSPAPPRAQIAVHFTPPLAPLPEDEEAAPEPAALLHTKPLPPLPHSPSPPPRERSPAAQPLIISREPLTLPPPASRPSPPPARPEAPQPRLQHDETLAMLEELSLERSSPPPSSSAAAPTLQETVNRLREGSPARTPPVNVTAGPVQGEGTASDEGYLLQPRAYVPVKPGAGGGRGA